MGHGLGLQLLLCHATLNVTYMLLKHQAMCTSQWDSGGLGSPCLMLGIMAALIPFANHDQAPRVTYQAAMGKQACGWYCTNWPRRMDAVAHVQMYPMLPIVSTRFEQILCADQVPSGANVMVCICTFGGYNQEDSLILNKSSVERGLFRTLCHRAVKDEEKAGADAERFENPTTVRDCANLRVGWSSRKSCGWTS